MKAYTYILTTNKNTALYTGVTRNLKERLKKHKENYYSGSFTARYNIKKLVYFECHDSMNQAIKREKQIKAGSRKKKIELINGTNREWKDLSEVLDS